MLWSTPLGPTTRAPSVSSDGGAFHAQRVRGTGKRQLLERRPPRQVVDHAHRIGFALERGPSGRRLEVLGAVAVKETDDGVAAKVCRVRHRRAPVAVGTNQDLLMNERGIARDERADLVEVIAPDRVRELNCLDEPRPARRLVASREHELRVGQLRGSGVDRFRMVLAHVGDRVRIAGVDGAEEFLGLTMQLFQVGTDGQAADGHDEPPSMSPWSAGVGQRRFGDYVRTTRSRAICLLRAADVDDRFAFLPVGFSRRFALQASVDNRQVETEDPAVGWGCVKRHTGHSLDGRDFAVGDRHLPVQSRPGGTGHLRTLLLQIHVGLAFFTGAGGECARPDAGQVDRLGLKCGQCRRGHQKGDRKNEHLAKRH